MRPSLVLALLLALLSCTVCVLSQTDDAPVEEPTEDPLSDDYEYEDELMNNVTAVEKEKGTEEENWDACAHLHDEDDTEDAHTGYLWVVGAMLSVAGSVASNLGLNIQKYAFMKEDAKLSKDKRKFWKNPIWWLGFAGVVLGAMGDFAALGLAAQSIVAPIGSLKLLANIFFAHFWLGEVLTKFDLIGTFFIISGSTMAVLFGDHTQKGYTVQELTWYWKQPSAIIYMCAAILLIIVFYALSKYIEPIKTKLNDEITKYDQCMAEDRVQDASFYDINITEMEKEYKKYEKLHPFSYCAVAGIFGGGNMLFGKMVAEMLGATFKGCGQMQYVQTWVFIFLMVSSIYLQIIFLAKGLSFFDAMYVVPVFECIFIVCSTIGGAAFFQEFSSFSWLQSIFFPLGICSTLLGVMLLTMRQMRRSEAGERDNQMEQAELRLKTNALRTPHNKEHRPSLIPATFAEQFSAFRASNPNSGAPTPSSSPPMTKHNQGSSSNPDMAGMEEMNISPAKSSIYDDEEERIAKIANADEANESMIPLSELARSSSHGGYAHSGEFDGKGMTISIDSVDVDVHTKHKEQSKSKSRSNKSNNNSRKNSRLGGDDDEIVV